MTTMLRQELEKRINELNEINAENTRLTEEKQGFLRKIGEMERTGCDVTYLSFSTQLSTPLIAYYERSPLPIPTPNSLLHSQTIYHQRGRRNQPLDR